jgi:hypothetical protein
LKIFRISLPKANAINESNTLTQKIEAANKALEKKPKSLTINMIHCLIKAQTKIDNSDNWCEIYKLVSIVIKNNSLNKDFRVQAVHIIKNYTDLYKM